MERGCGGAPLPARWLDSLLPSRPVPSQCVLAAGARLLLSLGQLSQQAGQARGEVRTGEAGTGGPAGGRAGAQGGAGGEGDPRD